MKQAKNLILKARESGRDPYLALLELPKTPSEQLQTSPSQRLMGRRTRTPVPVCDKALKPKRPNGVRKELHQRKQTQKRKYDKNAPDLRDLTPGKTVRFRKKSGESRDSS